MLRVSRCALRRTFQLGESATICKTFTRDDVRQFAVLSGDTNPIHTVPDSSSSASNQVIVHGVLLMGLFSAIGGTRMPGAGAFLVSARDLKFHQPVYSDQKVTGKLTITKNLKNKFLETDAIIVDSETQVTLVSGTLLLKV